MQVHIPLYDPATLLLLAVFSTPDKVGWPALVLMLRLLICLAAAAGRPCCAWQGVSTIPMVSVALLPSSSAWGSSCKLSSLR